MSLVLSNLNALIEVSGLKFVFDIQCCMKLSTKLSLQDDRAN